MRAGLVVAARRGTGEAPVPKNPRTRAQGNNLTMRELLNKKAELVAAMRALQNVADAAKRAMTADESAKFDDLDTQVETINAQIKREEKLASRETEITATIVPPMHNVNAGGRDADDATQSNAAFEAFIRGGIDNLTPTQRKLMQARYVANPTGDVKAAQTTGTGSSGGFTVPTGFSGELEKYLKAFGGVRDAARNLTTNDGRVIPWPGVDDTAVAGRRIAENSNANPVDVAFSSVSLNAYIYTSDLVLVPETLLQDSEFDVNALMIELLGDRIGRIHNTEFTNGTGTSQPQGVVTAAALGKTGATGQTTSVIGDDLIDLQHSLDPAYRKSKKAGFMLHDSSLKAIKKLKDSQGRYLWQASLAGGTPDTILDSPYTINQDMPVMAASAKSIVFGDFNKFIVRDVREVVIKRLVERYAENWQVGFVAFCRADARAINSAALKYYANSAT